jgi:hypothetical protein
LTERYQFRLQGNLGGFDNPGLAVVFLGGEHRLSEHYLRSLNPSLLEFSELCTAPFETQRVAFFKESMTANNMTPNKGIIRTLIKKRCSFISGSLHFATKEA